MIRGNLLEEDVKVVNVVDVLKIVLWDEVSMFGLFVLVLWDFIVLLGFWVCIILNWF